MKKIVLTILAVATITVSAFSNNPLSKNVYLPDSIFKSLLLANLDINTDADSNISVVEATAFGGLIDVSGQDIADLTGIEFFTNLTGLNCSNNKLNELYLGRNEALTTLNCSINNLTILDININTALTAVACDNNLIAELDVRTNTMLTTLTCSNNQLSSLDLSKNPVLTTLDCTNNSNLTCIKTTDAQNKSNWTKDLSANYNTDCAGSDNVYIPDVNFKQALVDNILINTDQDTEISIAEAMAYDSIVDVSGLNIRSMTGIAYFTNITHLKCSLNLLRNLDISKNTALDSMECSNNQLRKLDLSNNADLTYLNCQGNQLTNFSIASNVNLTYLNMTTNNLKSISLGNNTALKNLNLSFNELESIDVSNNTLLTDFNCVGNQITTLNLSQNTSLISLFSKSNNNLTCIKAIDAQDKTLWDKDDFVTYSENCGEITTVQENPTTNYTKTIYKRYNLFGAEVSSNYNGFVILKYTDGSSMKVIQE